jgi:hypothetical protein
VEVKQGWKEIVKRTPLEGEPRLLLAQRMHPELVELWTYVGDWKAIGRIAAEVEDKGIADPYLGEKVRQP